AKIKFTISEDEIDNAFMLGSAIAVITVGKPTPSDIESNYLVTGVATPDYRLVKSEPDGAYHMVQFGVDDIPSSERIAEIALEIGQVVLEFK
ncbi:MAG TPA: hypothetical protein VMQ58_01920, partial [Candidatus Saccharimonadales bacterium]|nr:hypothetical protein [Candidatus Saccharimonadales bacterium]